jgi:hypothetical protein
MASDDMTYLSSLMKIGTGAQVILRFRLSNLNGSNVGITDERNLSFTQSKWAQVA